MNVFDLLITEKEKIDINEVYLSDENRHSLDQLIKEYKYIEELTSYGLPVNHKVLLQGSSGCGKTMTAKAIATTLEKGLLILNLSNIINARIGETSQNLKQIFDKAARDKCVLFLDEFDLLAKERGGDEKDVGEMRRIVNTLLQLMDYLPKSVLLIAATNHVDMLDVAIKRRFQLKLQYELPSAKSLDDYYDKLLIKFPVEHTNLTRIYNISFAEAKDYTYTTVKGNIIKYLENID